MGNPQEVSFFGIGFGREATSQSTTPGGTVAAIPANNPLLNITKVNGVAVTASTPQQPGASGVVGDYTSGYILSPAGLTLGLTAANRHPSPPWISPGTTAPAPAASTAATPTGIRCPARSR